MGKIGAWSSPQKYQEERHNAAVARKRQRILMYNALLDEWELREDRDEDYLRDLRKRLHQAETQLKVMRP